MAQIAPMPPDRSGLNGEQNWRHMAESQRSKTLALRDLLQDAYEFNGLRRMAWFLVYFTFTIVFLGYNWSENSASFYAEMTSSLQAFGPTDFSQTETVNQLSMATAAQYATGYVNQLLLDSQSRNLPLQELAINQYISVKLIRLTADVASSCDYPRLHCYLTDPSGQEFGVANNDTAGIMPSGAWSRMENQPVNAYGTASKMMYVNLYNQSDMNATYNTANVTLQSVVGDAAFLGRYAISMILEVYATYDQSFDDDSAACFHLGWTLKSSIYADKMKAFKLQRLTSTIHMKTTFLTTFWDWIRLIMLVVYITCLAMYLAEEVDEGRRSALQYGTAARRTLAAQARAKRSDTADAMEGSATQDAKFISKMVRLGVWRYCTNAWNVVDIVGTSCSLIWAFGWCFIIARSAYYKSTYTRYMDSPDNLNALLDFSELYISFIYVGILNVLIVGLRLYKYMRYHSGLRVYYNLFISAWRAIKDFGLWFVYVMLVLASVVIMTFQVSGGNARFAERLDGINSMALVTFGVMDYDTFTDSFKGTGSWFPIIIALFWINIAVLSTVALNIVIAIVGNAYDEAKNREGPVEHTLVYIVWLRLNFNVYYVRRVLFQRWSVERFAQSWCSLVAEEINMDPQHTSHEFRYTKTYSWVPMKTARVYARWGLALLPSTQLLLTYFLDASSENLCARSPWEDAEVVEEALTSANAVNKRHKPQLPTYKWTLDTAMTRGQFMAFMLGLVSSGCAGLPQGGHSGSTAPSGAAGGTAAKEACVARDPPTAEEVQRGKDLLHATRTSFALKGRMCCCGDADADDVDEDDLLEETAGQLLNHNDYLNLSAVLAEELSDVDDVMCDLAARGHLDMSINGNASPAALPTKVEPMTKDGDKGYTHFASNVADNAAMEQERKLWRSEGGEPGPAWGQRLQELRVKWGAVVRAWREAHMIRTERRKGGHPADKGDLYTRNCASVFVAGVTSLRRSLSLSPVMSQSLRALMTFRPVMRFRNLNGAWNQHKVAAFYSSWVWEVYSAELLADGDWNNELDDMDLRIIELREALTKAIDDKMGHATQTHKPSQSGTLTTRPSTSSAWVIKTAANTMTPAATSNDMTSSFKNGGSRSSSARGAR